MSGPRPVQHPSQAEIPPMPSMAAIITEVCAQVGLDPEHLRPKAGRSPRQIAARRLVCYLARRHTIDDYKAIGEAIGAAHSVVIESKRQADKWIRKGRMMGWGQTGDRFIDVVRQIERRMGLRPTRDPEKPGLFDSEEAA